MRTLAVLSGFFWAIAAAYVAPHSGFLYGAFIILGTTALTLAVFPIRFYDIEDATWTPSRASTTTTSSLSSASNSNAI